MKRRYFHFRQTFLQGEVFPSLTFCYSYKLSHLILSNASIAHMCLCVYESLDGFFFFTMCPVSPSSPLEVPLQFQHLLACQQFCSSVTLCLECVSQPVVSDLQGKCLEVISYVFLCFDLVPRRE